MVEIARREFRENVRRPGYVIVTLLYPLFLLATLLLPSQLMERLATESTVGLVDHVGGYADSIVRYGRGVRFVPFASEGEADEALLARSIPGYVVIAGGSSGSYVSTAQNPAELFAVRSAVESAMLERRLADEGLGEEARSRVLGRVEFSHKVRSEGGVRQGSIFSFVVAYLLPILFIIPLFLTGQYLVQSVAEEKESRVVELILATPVSASTLLMGKVLGLCLLGIIQLLVWFAGAAWALASTTVQVTGTVVAQAVLFFLLGYLFYGVVMAGLGSLGSTTREAQYISMMASWFAIVPFLLLPAIQQDQALARALALFPFFTPMVMMVRLLSSPPDLPEVVFYSCVLSLSIALAARVFGRIFRASLLMYGSRPSIRHVWRMLRA